MEKKLKKRNKRKKTMSTAKIAISGSRMSWVNDLEKQFFSHLTNLNIRHIYPSYPKIALVSLMVFNALIFAWFLLDN